MRNGLMAGGGTPVACNVGRLKDDNCDHRADYDCARDRKNEDEERHHVASPMEFANPLHGTLSIG
jgi:hypothetical protein